MSVNCRELKQHEFISQTLRKKGEHRIIEKLGQEKLDFLSLLYYQEVTQETLIESNSTLIFTKIHPGLIREEEMCEAFQD